MVTNDKCIILLPSNLNLETIQGKGENGPESSNIKLEGSFCKSKRKAMNRNWYNQKANPALNTKAGNK